MNNLRTLRKQHGLSMKALGEALGLAESTISLYEAGKRQPDNDTLVKIANFFGVTTDYLLGVSNYPKIKNTCVSSTDNLFYKNHPEITPLPKTRKIPLLGNIACGEPITAVENVDDYVSADIDIPAEFALRCKGDSMINARIHDGDIVYIREQSTVDNGEIAAVLIDDEVTLKRFYKLPDYIELRAENPRYSPIIIPKQQAGSVRIIGKAVAFTSTI